MTIAVFKGQVQVPSSAMPQSLAELWKGYISGRLWWAVILFLHTAPLVCNGNQATSYSKLDLEMQLFWNGCSSVDRLLSRAKEFSGGLFQYSGWLSLSVFQLRGSKSGTDLGTDNLAVSGQDCLYVCLHLLKMIMRLRKQKKWCGDKLGENFLWHRKRIIGKIPLKHKKKKKVF